MLTEQDQEKIFQMMLEINELESEYALTEIEERIYRRNNPNDHRAIYDNNNKNISAGMSLMRKQEEVVRFIHNKLFPKSMENEELYSLVREMCHKKDVDYLHITPTELIVGGKLIMAEYITPSWFGSEVFINYRTDKVSSLNMSDEERKNLIFIIYSQTV